MKNENPKDDDVLHDPELSALNYMQAIKNSGLDFESADQDFVGARQKAEQTASNVRDNRVGQYWLTFFNEFSARCMDRCYEKSGDSKDTEGVVRLWLESFEPIWLAGCNWEKDLIVQKIKDGQKMPDDKYLAEFGSNDLELIKRYCDKAARDLEKTLEEQIRKYVVFQRKHFMETLRNNCALTGREFNEAGIKKSLEIVDE